jgi:hypothetical protein
MGLGSVQDSGAVFLSIAGGFIWNRKADESDPNYATQDYEKADKSTGTRQGARYADLTGKVVGVQFKTHAEYGENINVTFDSDGERYIISVSTNNRYSQDLMKALLKMDLSKDLFMKPYDFVGADKKRAQGISFRQDGEKLDLKVEDAPTQDGEWFKTAEKKKIKRFFEDLNDWFVAEVEEKITPQFKPLEPIEPKAKVDAPKKEVKKDAKPEAPETEETEQEEPEVETPEVVEETSVAETAAPAVTPLKMKGALRNYIAENYPGKELPSLDKENLVVWYNLSLAFEELPFPAEGAANPDAEVNEDDLDAQLNGLLKN